MELRLTVDRSAIETEISDATNVAGWFVGGKEPINHFDEGLVVIKMILLTVLVIVYSVRTDCNVKISPLSLF